MFDHIELRTGNIPAGIRFYEAVLFSPGFVLASPDESTDRFHRPRAAAASASPGAAR
jgi:hypothetical protein